MTRSTIFKILSSSEEFIWLWLCFILSSNVTLPNFDVGYDSENNIIINSIFLWRRYYLHFVEKIVAVLYTILLSMMEKRIFSTK